MNNENIIKRFEAVIELAEKSIKTKNAYFVTSYINYLAGMIAVLTSDSFEEKQTITTCQEKYKFTKKFPFVEKVKIEVSSE